MAPKTRAVSDPKLNHVIKVVLDDRRSIKDGISSMKSIKTIHDLLDVCKDPNKVNAIKWRNPSNNDAEEDLSDVDKEALLALPSYLMWLQNNHGTIENFPIDIMDKTNRNMFLNFLLMSPEERGGKADGTVTYDVQRARESEQWNQLGRFAPPPAPPPAPAPTMVAPVIQAQGGGTNATMGGNPDTVALNLLEKKLSPTTLITSLPQLTSSAGWPKWQVQAIIYFYLSDFSSMIVDTYVAPTANDHPDTIALHNKRNTLMFSALFQSVATPEGSVRIKRHCHTLDGVSAWRDLVAFYATDIMADDSANYYLKLLTSSRIPPSDQLRKGLAEYCSEWHEWVRLYHDVCEPTQILSDDMQLIFFEMYISQTPEVAGEKSVMDLQENPRLGQKAVKYDARMRMDQYSRKALQLDLEMRKKVLTSKRDDKRYANFTEADLLESIAENPYGSDNVTDATSRLIHATMTSADDYYSSPFYEVNVAEKDRRYGYLPKEKYLLLSPQDRKSWMSIPEKMRELIMTVGGKASPATPKEHGLSDADSLQVALVPQDTPVQDSVVTRESNMTFMEAMKANSTSQPSAKLTSQALAKVNVLHPAQSPYVLQRIGANPSDIIPKRNVSLSISRPVPTVPVMLTPNDILSPARRNVSMATIHHTGPSGAYENKREADVHVDTTPIVVRCVDGGANNGLGNPKEIRLLDYVTPARYIDVDGVGDIEVRSLRIGTFAAKTRLSDGMFVLLIFHEYGVLIEGDTVHSKIQISDGGCEVYDDPISLGGRQCIIHEEGIRIPLVFQHGLACIEMIYPSDDDIETLPRFAMTRSVPWDPTKYDKVRSRPTITEDPNAIQPDPSNGEHIPQSIDQSIRMIGEPLRQLQISHSSITTNIADSLLRVTTNDTQLVQEYLANIAFTSLNPQEPPLSVYHRTEPVGFPNTLGGRHNVWNPHITEELRQIEHDMDDINQIIDGE